MKCNLLKLTCKALLDLLPIHQHSLTFSYLVEVICSQQFSETSQYIVPFQKRCALPHKALSGFREPPRNFFHPTPHRDFLFQECPGSRLLYVQIWFRRGLICSYSSLCHLYHNTSYDVLKSSAYSSCFPADNNLFSYKQQALFFV